MMPKVIGNDSLIARVNEVQGCMYRQSNELGRLNKAVRRYKEENAKLRELVRRYVEYTSQDRCEGCVAKSRCNDGNVDECWQLTEIRELVRELGVGAD